MVIAYDLRYACDHFAGIGTHGHALLASLLELEGPERYFVLWNPALRQTRHDFAPIARHPRVTWVERSWPPLAPAHLVSLGRWLRRSRAAFYVSPYYLRPVAAGCPSALTIHDVWPLRMREGLSPARHLLYRLSLQWAAGARVILTSSEFSRREIVTLLRYPADRVHAVTLGNPPRSRAEEPVRPGSLPDGRFALVVGDNRPRKNLEILARVWALFGDSPPLRLVVAGRADPRFPSMTEFVTRHRARCVTPLGWVSGAELDWLYANATLVLFPSRYEGFGFPIVEAFDRGLPVVAADIETFREVAGPAARYADPDRPEDWVSAIRGLLESPEALEAARAAGRARAGAFDYARTARRTLELLRTAARA
ncbi:MAG TPA: glycosyltransferase family 1 protein [Dongiaceae bacterium]|nr:glycosyltransferase family 1 protein [Dongiaceae bacterium]